MPFKLTTTAIAIPFLALAACSNEPFKPVVDGQMSANYQSDLAACRRVSEQAQITNRGTTTGAVAGGLIGAADADDGDELESAIVGAVIGGTIGRASETEEVQERRNQIVVTCMRDRGHNVVG